MKNKKISKIFQKSVDKYTDGCYYTITKRKQHKTQYKVSQLLKGGRFRWKQKNLILNMKVVMHSSSPQERPLQHIE